MARRHRAIGPPARAGTGRRPHAPRNSAVAEGSADDSGPGGHLLAANIGLRSAEGSQGRWYLHSLPSARNLPKFVAVSTADISQACPFTGGSDLRRWSAIRCTGITEPLVIEGYRPVPREWTLSGDTSHFYQGSYVAGLVLRKGFPATGTLTSM